MAPLTWATDEQDTFLHGKLAAYIKAKENQKAASLTWFWNTLEEQWLEHWPVQTAVSQPVDANGSPLEPQTEEQSKSVIITAAKMKKRLKWWMRYQEHLVQQGTNHPQASTRKSARSLFQVLKKSKSTRPLRPVEIYQKLYHKKISDEVERRGHAAMNEEVEAERAAAGGTAAPDTAAAPPSGAPVLMAEELEEAELEAESLAEKKVRAARMSLWRTTSSELHDAESDEVRHEVEVATEKAKASYLSDKRDMDNVDDERTPEELQHGIDQIGAVYAKVHEMTMQETGWYGITLIGGPMPRCGGQVSTKTICFGQTVHGNDFAASVPNFDEIIKATFHKWLKRAFPHDMRDARGLPEADGGDAAANDLDGLITMDPLSHEDDEERPQLTKSVAPKHIRAPKPKKHPATTKTAPAFVAAALAPAATLAPLPTSVASPVPTTPGPRLQDQFGPDTPDFAPLDFTPPDFDVMLASIREANGGCNTFNFEEAATSVWNGTGPTGGGEEGVDPFHSAPAAQVIRPPPRPMHVGAAFTKDREVGGSPARVPRLGTVEVNGFQFPTTDLFKVFTKTPTRTPTLASITRLSFGMGSSTSFLLTAEALPAPSIGSIADATSTPPPPSTGPTRLTTPTPAVFTNSCPNPAPSALNVFTAAIANAMYIQSRPMANLPRGHPLAPSTTRAEAAKTAKAPAKRGRPRKNTVVTTENENTPPTPHENTVPGMTEAARVETARINRREQRKVIAETLKRGKAMDAKEAEREAKEKAEAQRVHNPAGGHTPKARRGGHEKPRRHQHHPAKEVQACGDLGGGGLRNAGELEEQ
ncbi:hypothetical protein B0H10DRAFT_2218660 [Mycena sp. CBHHK59/15]|nr:hypothetical protein B0H10DRAFT_2218660 [Mycena sp. CBHHK59/15]